MRRALARIAISGSGVIAMLMPPSAGALSSIGDAWVQTVDGLPCFSLPAGRASESRLVLYSLHVTETTERADWRILPGELWGFNIAYPGIPFDPSPASCIRYGMPPKESHGHGEGQPLQPSRIYRVDIGARPATGDGNTLGYKAEFCVKPVAGGATEVRMILWDRVAGRWRNEVCLE